MNAAHTLRWYEDDALFLDEARKHHLREVQRLNIPGYEILECLGQGGQGIVYRALQRSTRRDVAVKMLLRGAWAPEQQRFRFEREVELAASLRHEHIVRLYDSGTTAGGYPYYVMEYVEGVGLDDWIAGRAGPTATLPPRGSTSARQQLRETVGLMTKICEALAYAHQRGMIHRDLKPGNIRLDRAGEPHVLDFGLAKRLPGAALAPGQPTVSNTGDFLGSLPWASPEQVAGLPERIDVRTDVYTLGVILYQMLTREFPYNVTGSFQRVLDDIQHADPVRPSILRPEIDDELETIVLKCLAKEPERRYQTAGELARDLRRYLAGEPIEAKRDSLSYVLRKRLRRYKVTVTLSALLIVALVAGFVISLTLWAETADQRDEAEHQARIAAAVTAFMQDIFAAVDPYSETPDLHPDDRVVDALALASARVGTTFAAEPDVEAAIRDALGMTYLHLGLFDRAAEHLSRAARLRETLGGPDHPDTLVSREHFAELQSERGDDAGAEQTLRAVLSAWQVRTGDDSPETLRVMSALASTLAPQGNPDAAERVYRDVLERRRRVLGNDHPDTLEAELDLAWQLERCGRIAEATALFDGTLPRLRAAMGQDVDAIPHVAALAAELLEGRGRSGEARALYEAVIARKERQFGPEHPDTLTTLSNYARLLYDQQRYEQAQTLYREILARKRRALGDLHPSTLLTVGAFAVTLEVQRHYAEAEQLYREALDGQRRLHGSTHVKTLDATRELATLLLRRDKPQEAADLLRHAQPAYAAHYGDEHPNTLQYLNTLAGALCDIGATDDAEAMYRRVLDARRRVLGPENDQTLITLNDLALLLKRSGRLDEAETLYCEVLDIARRTVGPDHRYTLIALNNLACLVRDRGALDAAAALFDELAQLAATGLPADHWYRASFAGERGRCLALQGRYDEAEPLLLNAHAELSATLGPDHAVTRRMAQYIAALDTARGDPDAAAQEQAAASDE